MKALRSIRTIFTRDKLIEMLLREEDNPFTTPEDYVFFDDAAVIKEFADCGYLENYDSSKRYCFTDEGDIVVQKTLGEFTK